MQSKMAFLVTWGNVFRASSQKYAANVLPLPCWNNIFKQSSKKNQTKRKTQKPTNWTKSHHRVSSASTLNFLAEIVSWNLSYLLGTVELASDRAQLVSLLGHSPECILLAVCFCHFCLKIVFHTRVHSRRMHSVLGQFASIWLHSFSFFMSFFHVLS